MSIQKFEPYHGAVLTKIVRQQKMSLSLIEQSSAWAAYLVNTACVVYVKHATQGKTANDGGKVYRFTFAPEHVSELAKFEDGMPHCKVMVALVCATTEIAFFPVGQLWQCIDRDDRDAKQWVSVTAYPGTKKQLRLAGSTRNSRTGDEPIKVPESAIEKFEFPI